jgi:hypothetical protein
MAKTRYNLLLDKVRDWSNKPNSSTIPDSVIESCLAYSADECYRILRIPPLEHSVTYTVESADNTGEGAIGSPYGSSFTSFAIPEDLTIFNYVRSVAAVEDGGTPYANFPGNFSRVFNEVTDKRTFFDAFSEKYSMYNFMWMDDKIYIHPQIPVGMDLEINYYRRLAALDALYSVIPQNYDLTLSDALQTYLTVDAGGTALYFATSDSVDAVFATEAEALAYDATVTSQTYIGKEVPNWLRDQNERLLIWGALYNLGAYLFDDAMEKRYEKKFFDSIESMNKEEKWRRASGGNVQVNFNSNGLI